MKKKVKLILAGAAVIVLAAVGLYVLLSPVSVETEIMEKADLTETFTASATVTPKNSQYVCAPLVRPGNGDFIKRRRNGQYRRPSGCH